LEARAQALEAQASSRDLEALARTGDVQARLREEQERAHKALGSLREEVEGLLREEMGNRTGADARLATNLEQLRGLVSKVVTVVSNQTGQSQRAGAAAQEAVGASVAPQRAPEAVGTTPLRVAEQLVTGTTPPRVADLLIMGASELSPAQRRLMASPGGAAATVAVSPARTGVVAYLGRTPSQPLRIA